MWNTMVFIKYSKEKHLRYSVNINTFNLSDHPHKLIPIPMDSSYVHQVVSEPARCLGTTETEVHINIRNTSVKSELLHIATRHAGAFKYNALKIHKT